jgi:hypothetical protein
MGKQVDCVCRQTDSVFAFGKNGLVNQVHMVDRFFHSTISKGKSHDIRHQNTGDNCFET